MELPDEEVRGLGDDLDQEEPQPVVIQQPRPTVAGKKLPKEVVERAAAAEPEDSGSESADGSSASSSASSSSSYGSSSEDGGDNGSDSEAETRALAAKMARSSAKNLKKAAAAERRAKSEAAVEAKDSGSESGDTDGKDGDDDLEGEEGEKRSKKRKEHPTKRREPVAKKKKEKYEKTPSAIAKSREKGKCKKAPSATAQTEKKKERCKKAPSSISKNRENEKCKKVPSVPTKSREKEKSKKTPSVTANNNNGGAGGNKKSTVEFAVKQMSKECIKSLSGGTKGLADDFCAVVAQYPKAGPLLLALSELLRGWYEKDADKMLCALGVFKHMKPDFTKYWLLGALDAVFYRTCLLCGGILESVAKMSVGRVGLPGLLLCGSCVAQHLLTDKQLRAQPFFPRQEGVKLMALPYIEGKASVLGKPTKLYICPLAREVYGAPKKRSSEGRKTEAFDADGDLGGDEDECGGDEDECGVDGELASEADTDVFGSMPNRATVPVSRGAARKASSDSRRLTLESVAKKVMPVGGSAEADAEILRQREESAGVIYAKLNPEDARLLRAAVFATGLAGKQRFAWLCDVYAGMVAFQFREANFGILYDACVGIATRYAAIELVLKEHNVTFLEMLVLDGTRGTANVRQKVCRDVTAFVLGADKNKSPSAGDMTIEEAQTVVSTLLDPVLKKLCIIRDNVNVLLQSAARASAEGIVPSTLVRVLCDVTAEKAMVAKFADVSAKPGQYKKIGEAMEKEVEECVAARDDSSTTSLPPRRSLPPVAVGSLVRPSDGRLNPVPRMGTSSVPPLPLPVTVEKLEVGSAGGAPKIDEDLPRGAAAIRNGEEEADETIKNQEGNGDTDRPSEGNVEPQAVQNPGKRDETGELESESESGSGSGSEGSGSESGSYSSSEDEGAV